MVDFNNAFGGFGPVDPMLQQRLAAMAAAQNQTMVPMQPMAGPVGNMLESMPMAPQGMNMLERGAAVAPQMQPQVGFTPPGGNKLESAVATHGSGPMDLGAMTQPSQPQPMPMGDRPAMQRGFNPDKAEMLQDLFIGWASGSNVGDSLAKGALMMREGKKSREEKAKTEGQTNQTLAWLQSKGMDPAQAQLLASSPAALGDYLKSTVGGERGVVVNDRIVDPVSGKLIADYSDQATGARANRGLQPITGVDENNNPVIMQLGSDGTAVRTAMPEGVTLSKEPIRIDAGTEWVLLDPITRQPVGRISKNIAEAAGQEVTGKAQAERASNLPNVEAQADLMLASVDSILNDPARERGTGLSSFGNIIPGTSGYDFSKKVEQLQGQAFLQAFNSLKGGGAITEIEGKKAEAAIARLDTAQSEGAFKQALQELRSVIEIGKQRARKMAGVAPESGAPPADGGYRVIGVEE